ncbi:PREDICTED: ABC transporter G family member 24 [Camelina sativa]|uniref:ABC transporter G family member 24 n=1 Tax=Camelina sativa TaxID=90675 RepID=A0ABM0VWT8_CAMSA|nr:PREDICTED: ABC transporter G family member 24 [Camelina sativa]
MHGFFSSQVMSFNASQVTMLLNLKMSVNRRSWHKHGSNLRMVILVLWLVCYVGNGQTIANISEFEDNPALLPLVTKVVYRWVSNTTAALSRDLGNRAKFCFKDLDSEWNRAFNFSTNLDFLSKCIEKTKGDIVGRICGTAEMKFYFNASFNKANDTEYWQWQPNVNCNLTAWDSGCEPGWGCSLDIIEQVDLPNSKDFPKRKKDCMTCCEGFFCPRGLTCMIPCPLGAHCPLATLNKTTSICEPYTYQLPPTLRLPSHTCGGANVWADITSSSEIFCPAGSHCPTTDKIVACEKGHYCRKGSTSEKPCLKLSSCKRNTGNQNIHAFGIMFIAAVSTILLIIYNCSDHILKIREKRQAKSREAAVKKARAHQRWKGAREAAKKHVREIGAQITRTFPGKKSDHDGDTHMMLGPGDSASEVYEDIEMSKHSSSSAAQAQSSSAVSNERRASLDIEEESVKRKNLAKAKQTQTQIFKAAYDQIEKEKAMEQENKNLNFSGIVSMASNTETRNKRPLMELSYKDLTLTLKSNGKHVLRCVTGSMKPGRITAVMGPSGAGKTSLLSALAGKAVGCKLSGSILINGKQESIHSYKKIIGFVPQDDVVHGNLTVEENIWFHAKCRLPAGLSKAEKVLVVERTIDSLGLQPVRNSLVGTVEKRGISGGQRKRVNVGLEMVMEPSILFLDEPTSGLDSASSQLLLRALRHEAFEGVNICMVVHQPSYTLFKTFNDLVLLAKGGLTVYHGSVDNVEEYFSGLGINVPDRINPPDYYIDVLEGITIGNSGVDYKELPQRWMLHKGYSVPLDMRNNSADGLQTNPDIGNNSHGNAEQTFARELWGDVKSNSMLRSDKIQHNFLKSRDLSHRRTPSMWLQYKYFLGRVAKQQMREAKLQATDYLILLLAGACLGLLTKKSADESFGYLGYTYTIIAVSLLCKIAALRSFSLDKLHYWRESASGMSSSACFLAKDTIDFFNVLVKPLVYLSMFYFFTNPRSTFLDNYIILACLVYCVTGIAYALAIFLQPSSAQLFSVLLPVVLTLVSSRPKDDSKAIRIMADLSYPKWALQAFVIVNAQRYYGVWMITRCGMLWKYGYDINEWNLCIMILLLVGVATRGIAFVGMILLKKK